MALLRLPNEVLEHIATNLDLNDLCRLNTANRRCHAIAQRVLYSLASEWDEFQYGWPVSLAVAAVLGRVELFESVLRNTPPFLTQKCNVNLRGHSILNKWTKFTYKPDSSRPHFRTSLLHIVSFLGYAGMVSLVLGKRVSDGSSAYPRKNERYGFDSVTPLHLAARQGHIEVIELLLKAGANVSEQDRWGDLRALDFAIYNGRHDAVKLLILAGANPFAPFSGSPHVPSLARAAQLGDIEMVDLLLLARNTLKVPCQDALDSALSRATSTNMAQHLIHAGARITQGVLYSAAYYGRMEIMQLLLRNGGKFALEREDGLPNDVLHHGSPSLEMKRLILGIEPRFANVLDIDGNTPLDTLYALERGEPEDLQQQGLLLIEAGTEVRSSWALSCAAGRGYLDVVRRLLDLESQKLYLNARDLDGTTAIIRACRIPENHIIAELLIRAGCDIELQNGDWPPVFFAIHAGATSTVQCLLQAGCNIHALCMDGTTGLHLAAGQGNLDMVQCLLEAGLDPCAKTQRGKTPLHCCIENRRNVWYTDGLADTAALALLGDINLGFQSVDGPALDQNVVSRVKVVLCLVQAGADVSSQDDSEHTPLDSLALLTRNVSHPQQAIHYSQLSPWESMNRTAIGPTRHAQKALSRWMDADLQAWAIPSPHNSENSEEDRESDDDLDIADIFGES